MKKLISIAMVVMMAVMLLAGCGGEKAETVKSEDAQVEQKAPENKVIPEDVGKWVLSGGSYMDVPLGEEEIASLGEAYIEFKEDGTGVMFIGEKADFTWKDRTITVTSDGVTESTTYEIKDGELSLALDEGMVIKFKK